MEYSNAYRDKIKEDVLTDSKILVRPGVTDINYLKYSLIKRWSENIALGRKRSVEFNDTYSFKKM